MAPGAVRAHTAGAMERVYFTWPDRRFRYDCRTCGACCKGHGIGIDVAGGELVQLLGKRPELLPFLRRRGDAITAFNPRDRCWFLADDGLCRIEVEDGRAAKPASCRLFPFNRVFRIGSYTVVDFNSVICPLVAAPDADGVAHADVWAEIESIQDPAVIGTRLPARDAETEGAAFVTEERAIALAAFAAAAQRDGDGDPLAATWAAQADASALDTERALQTAAFTEILGMPWRAPGDATLRAAMWVTPSLRFNELYGPRQYTMRSAMPPVLARMWLAWLGFAALGEHLAGRPLGMQELTTLWSEQAPLMHVVARWGDKPSLKPGPVSLPGVDPGGLVRALGRAIIDNRKTRRPLGELIATLRGDREARVTALKSADGVLRAGFARGG